MKASPPKTLSSIYFSIFLLGVLSEAYITRLDQCEPIEIPRCRSMPYNMTQMPNLLHHNTQENARLVFQKFEILIDQHCSDVLLFLLCSIYVPICAVSLQPEAIPPCRSVCEKAKAGCEPLMNAYKVPWPDSLDCSKLPRYERGVCVSPEAFVKPTKNTRCVCKGRKPSFRVFKKYRYDYAIRAIIMKKQNNNSTELLYTVKVTQIIFSGEVKLTLNTEVILWVNSTCACPKLRKGREYLILGHEDSKANKLMTTPLSVAVQWKNFWTTKIQRWQDQLQLQSSDGKRRGTSSGRKRGQSRRPPKTVQQKNNDEIDLSTPNPPSPSLKESIRPYVHDLVNGYTHDLVNGYTHGGRYYTNDILQKNHQHVPISGTL